MTAHRKHFDLHRDGEMVVVAKRRKNVVDGIVTGIIAVLMAIPVLLAALFAGIWMLIGVMTHAEFHFAPRFDHFASPPIVHAIGIVFVTLLGILFAGGSMLLLRFFLKAQSAFFPYECRFKKDPEGLWMMQRKLWFLPFPWCKLGREWAIWCNPCYSRGDWGYGFLIRTKRRTLQLTVGGVFTHSKSRAKAQAVKDLDALKALFDIPGELKRWQ